MQPASMSGKSDRLVRSLRQNGTGPVDRYRPAILTSALNSNIERLIATSSSDPEK